MCAVSAISDYYQNTYPQRFGIAQGGFIQSADPTTIALLQKVVTLLETIDKRLADVECMDEEKAKFLAALAAAAKKKPTKANSKRT